jgi:nitrogen fixation protein FixH
MAAILIAFFGVVIAVNLTMAYVAVSGFGGTVVDNSYVASQNYNRWLEAGRAQAALGWRVSVIRVDDGRVLVLVNDAAGPWSGTVTATVRRVMGQDEDRPVRFAGDGAGRFLSAEPLAAERARLSLRLRRGEQDMRTLVDLP